MPVKKQKNKLFSMEISFGGISLDQKALLAKNLAVMQRAGLTIVESLGIVAESSRGKLKRIITAIQKSVESGSSLADAFGAYPKIFSGIFVSSLYAGEASGTLDKNLDNLSLQLQKEKELSTKIKGAMLYPMVVLSAAFLLGMAMSFLVLPKIIPLFKGLKTELPWTTKVLISFSSFVESYGFYLFFGIILFLITFIWLVRQSFSNPVTHWFYLRIPIVNTIVKNTNLARFSRILGTLLQSGLNVDEALQVTRNSLGNYYYKKAMESVQKSVEKGGTISDNLESYPKLFPQMIIRMVGVGEKSGKTTETLEYLSQFYELEVDNATKSLSTALEPLLLIVIGAVVAFLALSIITPIYDITGNLR